MRIIHRLTAFDRTTDVLAHQFDLGADQLAAIERLVAIPTAYFETHGSLPLREDDVRRIAEALVGLPAESAQYDWFLEPSGVPGDHPPSEASRTRRPIHID